MSRRCKILLATAIDKDHVNRLGWTALLEAVILGDGGPRIRRSCGCWWTPGANVNIADRDGVTPLVACAPPRLCRHGAHPGSRRRALTVATLRTSRANSYRLR